MPTVSKQKTSKLKIVFLTRNYPPTICGVGDHTAHLSQEMTKHGAEVHIICSADQKVLQQADLHVHPIVKTWNREGKQTIMQCIQSIQPDWFIVQYVPHAYHPKGLPFFLVSLYRAVAKQGVSILTVFHEVKIRPEHALKTQIISFLQGYIAEKLANLSTKLVTSIDFYDDNLKRIPRQKKAIVPIASNILPIGVNATLKQNLKERYHINAGAKVICTFGDRNVKAYLPVFDRLIEDYPNLIWLLCGKNSTPSVILKSRSYIRYVGEMSAADIYQHLSLGDVFFMPDPVTEEGQGGACNKSGSLACAMSLGIPLVGSKGDMNNQLLINGQNILLTDIRDSTAVYESLKSCLDSEVLSAQLGKNAHQFYQQHLTWAVTAEQFLKLMYPSVYQLKIGSKSLMFNE